MPYEAWKLQTNGRTSLIDLILGRSAANVSADVQTRLAPPWPCGVITAGSRTVSAACWIRRQSGDRTRLIHIGRPWAPLAWFDLVVTTPQYDLPARPNVMSNLMPLTAVETNPPPRMSAALQGRLAALRRPWITLLIGADRAPYHFTENAIAALAQRATSLAEERKGSVIALAGPRTPAALMQALGKRLPASAYVHIWGDGANPYPVLRHRSDRLVVTEDSAAVLAEALASGPPVEVFKLPQQPSVGRMMNRRFRRLATRHPWLAKVRHALIATGILTSVRELSLYHDALERADLFKGGSAVAARQRWELAAAATRAREILLTHGNAAVAQSSPPDAGMRRAQGE
jgi:mitochondrial fission protein ELM1